MDQIPKISDSEWQVMRVLWGKSPATAKQVVKALSDKTLWSPKTVRTLLNRLVRKEALGFEKNGREYHYYPRVKEEQCVRAETRSFLRRVSGGAAKPMLAAFLEEEKLSRREIEELKQILDEKGGG